MSTTEQNHNTTRSDDGSAWLGLKLKPPGGPREKLLAACVGLTFLISGFAAEKVLDKLSDTMFPDAAAIRAETLQNDISGKVQNIEILSNRIHDQLDGMDAEAAAAIERETQDLMAAIDSLRPDILAAQSIGNDTAKKFAEAKQRDLLNVGFSKESDFMLPRGGGATVCSDGYVFGTSQNNVRPSEVQASLSGPHGSHPPTWISPGQSVDVNTPDGVVKVTLQESDVNGSGRMGYSVNCP